MSTFLTRRKFMAFLFAALMACGMSLVLAPNAFAATPDNPEITVTSYNQPVPIPDPPYEGPIYLNDNDQHVVVSVDYGATVSVEDFDAVMDDVTIKIAGYDVAASNYYRPVDVSASGNTLVFDIGNVYTVDENGNPVAANFTAQYGSVIALSGTPTDVTAGDDEVASFGTTTEPYQTVIPSGVEITMTNGQGTNNLSATVTHAADVRSMVHIALYDGSTGSLVPVNKEGTDAGNLHVGTHNLHAHDFMTLQPSYFAAQVATLDDPPSPKVPSDYHITSSGANISVTSDNTNSKLYLYVFDDAMLNDLGWTFDGIVSDDGVMIGYLPD